MNTKMAILTFQTALCEIAGKKNNTATGIKEVTLFLRSPYRNSNYIIKYI